MSFNVLDVQLNLYLPAFSGDCFLLGKLRFDRTDLHFMLKSVEKRRFNFKALDMVRVIESLDFKRSTIMIFNDLY